MFCVTTADSFPARSRSATNLCAALGATPSRAFSWANHSQ